MILILVVRHGYGDTHIYALVCAWWGGHGVASAILTLEVYTQ